jgi:glycosyltransferase involved in cell wall biosynthesis
VMVQSVSLIVATRWRTGQELRRLLDSLVAQTYRSFEVIVVDQNAENFLAPLINEYDQELTLHHVRSETSGHAAANNVGLRICRGDIVAFPDDDCWYDPDLLRRVVDLLDAHPEWHGITGREAPIDSGLNNRRFDQEAGLVTLRNIWRRHISFTAFYRRAESAGLFYDERLGPGAGTIWGAGEETVFLLQFMERGCVVQYDPSLAIHHPDWGQGPYTMTAIRKAHRYGMAMGRILQTFEFPASVRLKYFARPLLGGAYILLRGRPRKAVYHWSVFLGRTTGWMVSLISIHDQARGQVTSLSAK